MKKISLNGIWQIKGATSDRGAAGNWPGEQPFMPTYDAPVPGSVQEALEWMTGDVHLGHNVYNARFIEEQLWLYSRTFVLEQIPAGERVRIVFEGLDLDAVIYVNGKKVGEHHNFYTPCRLDITDFIRVGENKLDVKIESGLYANIDKPTDKMCLCDSGKMLHRVWMRKPQSAFEWDWSPRLLNVGIYKPCYLEIAPFFAEETSVFHDLNADYSEAALRIRQFLTLPASRKVRVEARIAETGEGGCWEGEGEGEVTAPISFTVKNPRLWQPRNHGEPCRYTLAISVTDAETGEVVDRKTKKLGFRRVEIDRSPRPEGGQYFRLMINGKQLFAKGGNMIPADIIFSKPDRAAYEVLIDRAMEDNFNALRVWGGGIYESEDFYDLCDEKGIVVWQDFVSACATYPAFDREFNLNYQKEIRYEIRRLSVHPSLVIYSGNNEIDQFMSNPDTINTYIDTSLYYVILPRTLREEGDNHYYQPSSPWSPDGIEATDFSVGDQHPWSIGFSNRDYFGYREMDCRFPNEGGILGPTSLPNMMAALGEGQKYMHSMDFKIHDNSIADNASQAPELLLEEKLGIKIGLHGMTLPDYVYYGGFLQGEGLTEYILNFRRRMNDTTSSAIFWMYNDCWPATRSWTTVDYLRNRTPAFWPVKRSFAPIAVDIVKTEKGFDIYGINEYLVKKHAILTFGWARADGSDLFTAEEKVTLIANNSCVIGHMAPPEGCIPFAELQVKSEPLARRRFVEQPYQTLGLTEGEIRVEKHGGYATFTSDRFVFGVCLDLDGRDGGLSDNFFDLYPGRPYKVRLGKNKGKILYSYAGQDYKGV